MRRLIKKTLFSLVIGFIIIWVTTKNLAFAEENVPKLVPTENTQNLFAENYLLIELAKNFPVSFSKNRFSTGGLHPLLGYRYNLNNTWILGVASQFKLFRKKDTDQKVPLWTLMHESLYVIRLYHPNYFLIGPQILYFLPIKSAKVPFQREVEYRAEIGFGASLSFFRIISKRFAVSLGFNRWRGTGTTRFQAIEAVLGLNIALSVNKNK